MTDIRTQDNSNWRHMTFVTVLHFYATGPGQELHKWLADNNVAETTLVEHPFPFSARRYARIELKKQGAAPVERKLHRRNVPAYLRYALDFLRTLRLLLHGHRDVYIGNGCFDALAGIVLRRLGKVKRVILYTIDYAPEAGGRMYAKLYRFIDRFCCCHVDVIWNLSERMHAARLAEGMKPKKCAPALRVPHGTHARALRSLLRESPDPFRIAFMGHVLKKSGVQLFLNAMNILREKMSRIHLDVLGSGPYLDTLKSMAHELGLDDHVTFHGYVKRHEELEQTLMRCGIGLALYSPDEDDFSIYADPGKPKVYLSCGLPVIIVDVPEVAGEIDARGAGVKISYDVDSLCNALVRITSDYDDYRARALEMGKDYDWDCVFTRAIEQTGQVSLSGAVCPEV